MRLSIIVSTVAALISAPLALGATGPSFLSSDPVCAGLRHETVAIFPPDAPDARSDNAWERARGLYLRDLQRADLARQRGDLTETGYTMIERLIDADLEVLYAQADRRTLGDAPAAARDIRQAETQLQAALHAADSSPYAESVAAAHDALSNARHDTGHSIGETYASMRVRLSRLVHDALCADSARGA